MKKTNNHHYLHASRIILLGVLLVSVSLVRVDAYSIPTLTKQRVLAYATSMSRADLFAAANASRSANGLGPLSLNGQLNNSAQAKAQHMADNNYWAHVAPDGTQPWYFFSAAGYSYSRAGENLAYGFSSGYAVNDGWMNSPGHKANILGDYVEVGFGFVNSPNFQGGEQTIVVAHYATPVGYSPPAPAPEPAPAPPAPLTTTRSAPPANTPTPIESSPADTSPTDQQAKSPDNAETTKAPSDNSDGEEQPVAPVAVGTTKAVSVFEQLRLGNAPTVAIASLMMTLTAAAGFALTHRSLMRHAFTTGENFAMTHPTFDAMALSLALAMILSTTAAYLQ